MVALDPDEAVRLGHGAEPGALAGRQAARAVGVVEAVAEGDHHAGLVAAEQQGEAVERGVGVPGRQQLAAAGVGGAFLQVQVGDREQAGGRPEQRAGRVEHQPLAGEVDGGGGHGEHGPLPQPPPARGGGGRSLPLPLPLREGVGGRGLPVQS